MASQSSQPQLSRAQREQEELNQRINEILFHDMQLQRTLWLVVMKHGGTVIINEKEANPLWDLKYERVKDNPDLLTISAATLPEVTPEQLDALQAKLLGTKADPGPAMDELKIGEYPKSYVVRSLMPRIVFTEDKGWITREAFDLLPKKQEPPQTQPPKSDAV